jgi:acetylornithine deacetylase/succinyl-diaminopimelate desuccinylase family protein
MDAEDRIRSFVAAEQGAITSTLADLVAIATVNPPGLGYEACARFFSHLLQEWGIDHRVVTVSDGEHPRLSIVGGYGPGDPGLHFHGHYDVVSAQSPDQFRPEVRAGRLYGRGAADMKGGIVAMLFALRALQVCGIELERRVTLTLVPDEETGGRLGVRYLDAEGLLPRPALGVLMPEPSSGVIWHACRGVLTLRVTVKGKPAHGAFAHHGVNAFEGMVGVMNSLLDVKQRVVARQTALPVTPPEARHSLMLLGGASASGADFNVVPATAWFSIERRLNPEETLAQARAELECVFDEHRARGLGIEVEVFQQGDASVSPVDAPLGRALAEAAGRVAGTPARFELCPGVLETRFFSRHGVPGYGYGPGLLGLSHGPEEHIALDALFDCTSVYAMTAARLLGKGAGGH